MPSHQLINVLVSLALIELMFAIGLGVSWDELMRVLKDRRLMWGALFANYVCFPAATLGLLLWFNTPALTEAGFLILAVCPGASYGPPIASWAKGNLSQAVGLMVVLAGSSAAVAPLLLHVLLPLLSEEETIRIDLGNLVGVLVVTQFLPLCAGLALRQWRPALSYRWQQPAKIVALVLNPLVIGLLIATHLSLFREIKPVGLLAMTVLLIISLGAGWWLGGPESNDRRTLALTTSLRNVGLSLVIATGSFPGTPAVTAVMGYGFFEIIGSLLLATWWRRTAASNSFASAA